LTPDGYLDGTFGAGGIAYVDVSGAGSSDNAADLVLQPDGKILISGESWDDLASNMDMVVVRYNPSGELDLSFDGDGRVIIDFDEGYDLNAAVELQADGKILLVGDSNELLAVARLHPDGNPDAAFGVGGKIRLGPDPASEVLAADAALQSTDGKLVVAGTGLLGGDRDFALARIQTASEGTLTLDDGETGAIADTGVTIRLNSGGPCTFTALKFPVPPGGSPATWGELPVHWELTSNCATLNYDLILSYTDDELAHAKGALENFLTPLYSADGGSTWVTQAGELDTAANSITLQGMSTLGQWGVITQAPGIFWLPILFR
jgi:uncharacterized delta-60 repeat protein